MSGQVDLDALRALEAAATPGPWESGTDGWVETASGDGEDWCFVRQIGQTGDVTTQMFHGQEFDEQTEADAAFIAASRNALPALLDEVATLRAQVAAVLAVADELDAIDPLPYVVLDGCSLGGAVRWAAHFAETERRPGHAASGSQS